MNRYSVENTELILQLPLKTRGRPKVRKMNHNRLKNSRFLYGNSNLAYLLVRKKLHQSNLMQEKAFCGSYIKSKKTFLSPALPKVRIRSEYKVLCGTWA